MSPRWNTSERTYLLNLMDEFFVNGEVRDPSVVDWPRVIRTMTIEQARHRPDGALYEQDPWPIRTYNIELLISAWRHARIRREKAARKISDQIMQENDPEGGENELSDDFLDSPPDNDFEARFPDNWAREFEEILAPLRHEWAQQARLAAQEEVFYQAFRQLLHTITDGTIYPLSQEDAADSSALFLKSPPTVLQ